MSRSQRFFISFNSKDRQKAEWIAWTLRDAGHEVAVHTWEVPAGGNIPIWMNEKLAWAERLIAVVSPDYVDAVYSMMEWTALVWGDPAGASGSVIPVIVRPTPDLPPLLVGLSQIDLTGCEEQEAAYQLIQRVGEPNPLPSKPKFQAIAPDRRERGPTSKPDFQLEAVLTQYLDSVVYSCGTLRVIGMDRPGRLSDLFVRMSFLKLVRAYRPGPEVTAGDTTADPDQVNRVSLDHVLDHETKVVVIGGPGLGKSTLLRFLALSLASQALEGDDRDRIPIFIPLQDFAMSSRPFTEYVVELFVGQTPPPGLQSEVEALLRDGRCWVFLDGLDEVESTKYDIVLASIARLTLQYRKSRFLVTTRPGLYYSQLEQFDEYELAPFDGDQIREFVTRWFGPDGQAKETLIHELAHDSRMEEIASTPLLLALLCLSYQHSGRVPGNRAAFYDDAIDVLLRGWDASRGLHRMRPQNLTLSRLRKLYSSIAERYFRVAQFAFERHELERTLSHVLHEDIGLQEDELDAPELLPMLESQHGLLVKQWRGVYAFSHLTIQEYLTAAAIGAARGGGRLEFGAVVLEHLGDPRWREVIVLATQLKQQSPDTIVALADALDQLKSPAIERVLVRVGGLIEDSLSISSLARKLVAFGFAVYDYDLTAEVYWDKSFAAGHYKAAFGLGWNQVPSEDYRAIYQLLGDMIRQIGEQSPELVTAPVAIWQGYGEEGWGYGPSIRNAALRANIDPDAVASFEGDRLSPAAYDQLRRFVYAASVLVECVGVRSANAADRAIFG